MIALRIPKGTALSVPEGIALRIPKGTALSVPEGITLRIPKRTAPSVPEGIALSTREGTAPSIPEGPALTVPQGIARRGLPTTPNHSGREWWRSGAPRLPLVVALAAILAANLLSACSAGTSGEMSAASSMPDMIQSAPATVREAYVFAAAHPQVMQNIPCYCGCGSIGHTSNYACYIAGQDEKGALIYDEHALGCSICVDITQDTMRLINQGWEVADIRTEIDRTYSQYGPSNMP